MSCTKLARTPLLGTVHGLWAGWSQRKPGQLGARLDPLRSALHGKYKKPGIYVYIRREACAVFFIRCPLPSQSAHAGEKGEVTLPPNAKITSQYRCPLKCHYPPSFLSAGGGRWFLLGQTGSISAKTSRLETAAYRSRLALLRKTLAAFRPRLANDLAV